MSRCSNLRTIRNLVDAGESAALWATGLTAEDARVQMDSPARLVDVAAVDVAAPAIHSPPKTLPFCIEQDAPLTVADLISFLRPVIMLVPTVVSAPACLARTTSPLQLPKPASKFTVIRRAALLPPPNAIIIIVCPLNSGTDVVLPPPITSSLEPLLPLGLVFVSRLKTRPAVLT